MNFEFSDEQKMLRQTARDFVDKENYALHG